MFYFVTISLFNGALMFGYSTIFTTLPVFSIMFDQDVSSHVAMNYSPLYKTL